MKDTFITPDILAQVEALRALYRASLEQAEQQRLHLARELHDGLLNDLAALKLLADEKAVSPRFFEMCDQLIAHVRRLIALQRPPMLNYGLGPALQTLAAETAQLAGEAVAVRLAQTGNVRYPPTLEEHLFRIAQQACENALRHAGCRHLDLTGNLTPEKIELMIADDGKGFTVETTPEVTQLVQASRYGLAGMVARAAIIGADLQIVTAPGQGTQVRLRWQRAAPPTA